MMRSYVLIGGLAACLGACGAAASTAEGDEQPAPAPPPAAPGPPAASAPPPPPPPPPAESGRTIWDGVYTAAQAQTGAEVAQNQCTMCHSVQGEWPLLVSVWSGRTLDDPFEYVSMTMPQHNPGGLQPAEYAAVMAYILQLNGAPAGTTPLPTDEEALAEIQVVRR